MIVVERYLPSAEHARLIAELKPDVAVIDAQLGGGAGMEVLRRAKSLNPPPLIIMTATSPLAQYQKECLKEGADLYFDLPEELEAMVGSVRILAGRCLREKPGRSPHAPTHPQLAQ